MKYDLSADCCRICLKHNQPVRPLFEPELSEKFLSVTGIVLMKTENDNNHLPENVCESCERSLNMAYDFRIMAKKSDEIIQVFGYANNKDKIIVALKNGKMFKLSKDLTLKVLPKTTEIAIPTEIKEEETIIYNEDDDEIFEEEYLEDDSFVKIEYIDEHPVEDSEIVENEIPVIETPTEKVEEIAKRINLTNKYEVVTWTQENPNDVISFKLKVKDSKDKIEAKKPQYICEICGNSYSQTYQFRIHMRRHNNEKPFSCDICTKNFITTDALKRHVAIHTGNKPFKCELCPRRFYDKQSKNAHQVVHTGERPHNCTHCGKSYAYACILKKHLLIHENIKLYKCDYCDKDFRLLHHLKQHQETQVHIDTMAKFMLCNVSDE